MFTFAVTCLSADDASVEEVQCFGRCGYEEHQLSFVLHEHYDNTIITPDDYSSTPSIQQYTATAEYRTLHLKKFSSH